MALRIATAAVEGSRGDKGHSRVHLISFVRMLKKPICASYAAECIDATEVAAKSAFK